MATRPTPPLLKVPSRPWGRSFSSHSAFSPSPFVSPSPTPRPRPRPAEAPAWFSILLLHTLPLYIAHGWISSEKTPVWSATISLSFLTLLGSSITFLSQPWTPTSSSFHLTPTQLALLVANGFMLATSTVLKLQSLRSCGPLVAILVDYAGTSLGKFIMMGSDSSSRYRGLLATAAALLLLAKGWTRESCSPFAIKDKVGQECFGNTELALLPVWIPLASGLLSSSINYMTTRTSLRRIAKKRVHGSTSVVAALLVLPMFMLQLDNFALVQASALWPLTNMIILGIARTIYGDTHFEERLQLPHGSLRHFFITSCSTCLLDLWFGLDISPLGVLLSSCLLGFGIHGLADSSAAFSWESIADRESSASLAALVSGPVRYILSNSKSRKIATFLAMNTAFMFVEFIYGFASNSLGLVSDACHMLFDCAALAIGLYASYISKLQANGVFTYGYGRFEVLSGYANAVLLVLVASLIVLESVERILDPPDVSTESLLLVSFGGLLVNVVGLIFFHDEHHHAHGGGSCSHAHHTEQKVVALHLDCDHVNTHSNCHHENVEHKHCGTNEHDHFHKETGSCKSLDHQSQDGDRDKQQICLTHDRYGHHQQHHHQDQDENSLERPDNRQPQTCAHQDSLNRSPDRHGQGNHLSDSLDPSLEPGDYHQHQHQHDEHGNHQADNHQFIHKPTANSVSYRHSANHYPNHVHEHAQEDQHHSDKGSEEHHHHHQHHHIDHNMQGIFLHVLADTLGSVGVVISTLLIKYKGWIFSDAICSIFISTMIIASVIPLLRNTAEILLQRTPRTIEKRLEQALERVGHVHGIGGFERLHVWSLTNHEVVGTLQLHASTGADKGAVHDDISRLLNQAGITDLTIQVEEMT